MSAGVEVPEPALSVILPVRNMAGTIEDQLAALARQASDRRFEVIVADNGSTDGSAHRAARWADRLPGLRVVDASHRRGVSHARNVGIATSAADRFAFCDADDVVDDRWVKAMAGALDRHAFVAGSNELHSRNASGIAALSPQYTTDAPLHSRFLRFAEGGNLGVRREVIDAIGGFAHGFVSGEDVDFTWRAQLAGFDLHFEPGAIVHRALRQRPGRFFLQQVNYGRAAPHLYTRYRSHGMPRSPFRDTAYDAYVLLVRLPDLLSAARRYAWLRRAGWRTGLAVGSLERGVFFL